MSSYFGLIRRLKDSRNYVGELARQYSLDKALRDQVDNSRYRSFSRSESQRLILRELPGVLQNDAEFHQPGVPEEPDNIPGNPTPSGVVTMMINFDHELTDRSGMNNNAIFEFTNNQLLFADGMGSTQLMPTQVTSEGFGLPSEKGRPIFAAEPSAADQFGIRKIYDTKVDGDEWYMDNFNVQNGYPRTRFWKPNPVTQGVNEFSTTGSSDFAYIISSSGYNRNLIQPDHIAANTSGFIQQSGQWKNVEITGYFEPTTGGNPSTAEIKMSVRHGSGTQSTLDFPEIQASHDCEYCGYWGGLRNMDNAIPFFHKQFSFEEDPSDAVAIYKQGPSQGSLMNQRFGMKFIVYNDENNNVKLEMWLDKSNNNTWVKVHERTDSTGWNYLAGSYTNCGGTPDHKILFGGPIIEIWWDDVLFTSNNWSVREIELIGTAPTPTPSPPPPPGGSFGFAVDFNPISKSTYDKLWVPFSNSTQIIYDTGIGFSTVQRWLPYDISDTYPRATSKLKDFNGAVFNKLSPSVYLIFWGDAWNQEPQITRKNEIIAKTQTLLNTTYFDALWQYRDIKKPVWGNAIVSTFSLPDQESLHTDQIRDCVINSIEDGHVPHPNSTTSGEEWFDFHHYYFVYLPPGKDIGGGFWGAHSAAKFDSNKNKFFAWGTQQYYSGQFDTQGYDQYTQTDVMMQIFSHELINSLAYPYPGEIEGYSGFGDPVALGGGPAYAPCGNQQIKRVADILVQSYWSDVDGKCVCPGSGDTYTPKPSVRNSPTGSYRYRYLWHKQDDKNNGAVAAVSPDGTLYFNVRENGTEFKVKSDVHAMWKVKRWYEIFFAYNTTTNQPTIWINDFKYENASSETLLFNDLHGHFIFGNWNMGQTLGQFRGRLDDMILYRGGVVTDQGVANHFTNGLSITDIPLDNETGVFVVNRSRVDKKLEVDTFVADDVIVEDAGKTMNRNGITVLTTSGSSNVTTANTIHYAHLGNSALAIDTIESKTQIPYHTSGVLTKMYVRILSNSIPGDSTITVRRNGVDTFLSVIIPANQTGVFEDNINHAVIQSGDLMSYKFTPGNTTGTIGISLLSVVFSPDLYTTTRFTDNQAASFTHASSSRYFNITGRLDAATTTEAFSQTRIARNSRAKNLYINISANARVNNTTIRSRKNGANGKLVITIPAGTTGFLYDLTNSDALLADDLYNLVMETGAGTESITIESVGVEIEDVNDYGPIITARTGSSAGLNLQDANTTRYYTLGGNAAQDTVENNKKIKLRETCKLAQLSINVNTNTVTATSTLRLRKNGANANQVVTIPASTTGIFKDIINTDDILPDDELDFQLITGATGTNLTIRSISINTIHKPETVVEIAEQVIPEPIPDT